PDALILCAQRPGSRARKFALGRVRWRVEPPAQVLERQAGQRTDPRGVLVEAGDGVEFLAAGVEKCRPSLERDLFQRLQAVAHEARAGDVDPAYAVLGQGDQRRLGIRLEPFAAAESRLKRHGVLLGLEPQL